MPAAGAVLLRCGVLGATYYQVPVAAPRCLVSSAASS